MSLSNWKRLALIASLVLAPASLAACSFQPVYSGALAQNPQLQLAYAEPKTRLEQIVYQDLAFRLGKTSAPNAPLVSVVVSASSSAPYLSVTANPNAPYEATATATLTLTLTLTPRDGTDKKSTLITRTAKAQFTQTSQVLANQAAATEAQERAARAVAESLRLALLAALAKG